MTIKEIATKYGVSYQTVFDSVRRTQDKKYAKRRAQQQATCRAKVEA
jgi:transposase